MNIYKYIYIYTYVYIYIPKFDYGAVASVWEKDETNITDFSVWTRYYDVLRISPMSEYALSIPMVWMDIFFESIILDIMWLSQNGKRRLDVEREVAFRDANTELSAAK